MNKPQMIRHLNRIARVDQEAFTILSQKNAYAAQQLGLLTDEIMPTKAVTTLSPA